MNVGLAGWATVSHIRPQYYFLLCVSFVLYCFTCRVCCHLVLYFTLYSSIHFFFFSHYFFILCVYVVSCHIQATSSYLTISTLSQSLHPLQRVATPTASVEKTKPSRASHVSVALSVFVLWYIGLPMHKEPQTEHQNMLITHSCFLLWVCFVAYTFLSQFNFSWSMVGDRH